MSQMRTARRRMIGAAGTALICLGLTTGLTGGAATAAGRGVGPGAGAGSAPPETAMVRVGPAISTPRGARRGAALAPDTLLHVTVTLRPRDPAALAAYAADVATPGSADYHRYLSPAGFAARFGPASGQIALVRSALRGRGLDPGPTSPGGLSIPITGSAASVERAFAVSLQTIRLPRHRFAVTADARPAVPSPAAGVVQTVLGLDSNAPFHPLLERTARTAARLSAAGSPLTPGSRLTTGAPSERSAHLAARTTIAPRACAAAQTAAQQQRAYTADQIASAYGFSPVYAAGDGGAGVTVAVYELESDDPADIAAFQSCYGTQAQISYVRVDGGAGSGPGTGEAALDIENLIGFAPDVNVLVYQGPNSESDAPGSGPYDVFKAIVTQDRAQVVTVSWGQCEQAVTQPSATAENTLFEEAAVQGQTIVAADGDSGAQDCNGQASPSAAQAAVDDPSSQPYVTGVGGTTLSQLGPRPSESVWNSGGTPLGSVEQAGASGGGVSAFWPMAPAQLDAAAGLGVRAAAAAAGNPCGASSGACRGVPDVSADADPATGYVIYWNGSGAGAGEAGWQSIGGTSAAAPVWAALMALADGSQACAGNGVGFADPALYRAAGSAYSTDFNDITVGNNDFTGTNSGQFAARRGYDLASGLGTPEAASLIPALCSDTVRLAAVPAQRSTVGTAIRLHLRPLNAAAGPVSFTGGGPGGATGLPGGLHLRADGTISGRPRRPGRFAVHLIARDAAQGVAQVSFPWVVGARPRISRVRLGPVRDGRATLALTVTAGRGAPDVQSLTLTLPRPLRLTSGRAGVTVRDLVPGGRHGATVRATGARTLQISLRQPAAAVRIIVGSRTLDWSGRARSGRPTVTLTLSVTDASAGRLRLSSRVRAAA
jgi:hypothetical protein